MQDSDRLAIAAHMHVLLRRKTGRVTDTEWMAVNADYAREVVRFARLRALQDAAPELDDWAARLEQAWQAAATAPAPRAPLLAQAGQTLRERLAPPADAPVRGSASPAAASAPDGPRYVGGLR
ncbi:hypothetical protein [Acidovorax lacteus]|uniref:Uncharacterized protein n=1 Tax=Acidovorax lacteus TaxID=1924988 RepID=A0ABP8LA26_9BURK